MLQCPKSKESYLVFLAFNEKGTKIIIIMKHLDNKVFGVANADDVSLTHFSNAIHL